MKKIFLSNDILLNQEITNEGIAAYIALMGTYLKGYNIQYVTVKHLAFILSETYQINPLLLTQLFNGLEELIDKNIITVIAHTGRDYLLNLKDVYIEPKERDMNSPFTVIFLDEVRKITNMDIGKVPRFTLLRYFAILISTISYSTSYTYAGYTIKNFVGFMPINYLKSISGINSDRTISKYNNLLEQAELIYIYRTQSRIRDKITGQYHNETNNYGRYCDKEYIQKYAESRTEYLAKKNDYTYTHPNVKEGNSNRRLTQLYNSLVSGKMYSNDKVQQIYNHIFQKNERTLEKLKIYKVNNNFERVEQIYKNEWKDEAIFEQFPFLQRKEHSK